MEGLTLAEASVSACETHPIYPGFERVIEMVHEEISILLREGQIDENQFLDFNARLQERKEEVERFYNEPPTAA